jgi:hypothetical protein
MLNNSIGLLVATVLSTSVSLGADKYKMVTEDISEKKSAQTIEYFVINEGAVPAAKVINAKIREDLVFMACGASEDPDRSYDYNATASVISINSQYVSYSVSSDSDCGGAHPNYTIYFSVYNSITGELINMSKEVPAQDLSSDNPDYVTHEKFQKDLATVMLATIKKTNSTVLTDTACFEDMTDEQTVAEIAMFWPAISGITDDKKIITTISPPHAATPCRFELPVEISDVKKFFAPTSIVLKWLK